MVTFLQALPPEGEFRLLSGDKKSGELFYRDEITGEHFRVPSVWYNQPVAWRIEAMEFYAAEQMATADKLLASRGSWLPTSDEDTRRAARMRAEAGRCRALAGEMRRTGEVLA